MAGGGRGSFNVRFAQPSRDVRAFLDIFSPADIPPFADRALLAREARSGTVPKLFLSNGSSEYWIRCASLIHTTPDGRTDLDPMPTTRIYFFAGAQHSMGTMPPRKIAARNLGSINDYRCALHALLIDMQAWIKDGEPPPASRMPKFAERQLVPLSKLAFPNIPGVQPPKHMREAYRLDFSTVPPKIGPAFPTFVPQVNSDGNELGGIDMPEIRVPLGTSTGWNLRSPGATGDQFALSGSWIPFLKTAAERKWSHDSRASIAERYANKNAYLSAIETAAERLVTQRLLLQRDVSRLRARAGKEWDYAMAPYSLSR